MYAELQKVYAFPPEAYTSDYGVHWGNWPLRPEFAESTYFLYMATSDPFYLEIGKQLVRNLQLRCRVKCGFVSHLFTPYFYIPFNVVTSY